ncbi:hypothetical protein B0H14DRAFT_3870158 [Mycena olivaceomarginata]|nr:hypothetical protein B0H14DRAFT_3870158 [Mycena olivaceomarginata]
MANLFVLSFGLTTVPPLPSFILFSLPPKMFRISASFVLALLATSVLTAGAAPVQTQKRALDLATVCQDLTNVEGITTGITNALDAIAGIAGSGTTGIAGAPEHVGGNCDQDRHG